MRYGFFPIKNLQTWAALNGVGLSAASIKAEILDDQGNSKGGGLVASKDVAAGEAILRIPAELMLSIEQVEQCMKADSTLQRIMEAATFAKVGSTYG
jgi:hypothetical protein